MPVDHPTEIFVSVRRNDAYRVSNYGRVQCCWSIGPNARKTEHWRDLKLTTRTDGYQMVTLAVRGTSPKGLVHVLVAEAFIGPKEPGMDVRHLDGNKTNNVVDNLAYGTRAENMDDTRRLGRLNEGERNGRAKLSREQVLEIRRLFASGISQADIVRRIGTSPMTVSNIVRRKIWRCLS